MFVGTPHLKSIFCVLLATYNGARHLDVQLRSVAEQNVARINVIASDDGSTDDTLAILKHWQKHWSKGKFDILKGPCAGFAENFRSLMIQAETAHADFLAFSDQDDVWLSDKLAVAASALDQAADKVPQLYCGRTTMVNEAGRPLGQSLLMARPPSFRNALVQSIAGGNTMVMNRPAASLLRAVSNENSFVSHDWWAYLWVTGVGGKVVYDHIPRIFYRQHGDNLIGSNSNTIARLSRMRRLLKGQFSAWTDHNLKGLLREQSWLTDENADLLRRFAASRAKSRQAFLHLVWSEGIFRQSRAGTVSLYLAIALGRL